MVVTYVRPMPLLRAYFHISTLVLLFWQCAEHVIPEWGGDAEEYGVILVVVDSVVGPQHPKRIIRWSVSVHHVVNTDIDTVTNSKSSQGTVREVAQYQPEQEVENNEVNDNAGRGHSNAGAISRMVMVYAVYDVSEAFPPFRAGL